MRGLGRYYQLQVTCHGLADPVTGYFINIKDIDREVHNHAVPRFEQALSGSTASEAVPLGQLGQRSLDIHGNKFCAGHRRPSFCERV